MKIVDVITETKKRLKIVTKITRTTVISCTDENDKQFLVVKKEKIKNVLITVKSETEEIKQEIRKEKTKVSLKIVKNKKKQEKLLEKLDIMLNPTTMASQEPNISETPTEAARCLSGKKIWALFRFINHKICLLTQSKTSRMSLMTEQRSWWR